MGRMTDDMTRLCDEILAGRGVRADFLANVKDAVGSIKEETAEMRAGFRESHENMAAEMRVAFADGAKQLKQRVSELSRQNADTRQATRQSLEEMAREQRTDLNDFIYDLADTVTTTLDGFLSARADMAAETKAGLGAFCDGLRRDAAALKEESDNLMAAIRKVQSEAARDSREERLYFLAGQVAFVNQFMDKVADTMAGIRQDQENAASEDRAHRQRFVYELKTNVAGQQTRFSNDRHLMSQEMMDQLKSFDQDIKLHVRELKAAVEAMRREFSDDLAGAKAAWGQRKATATSAAPAKPKQEKTVEKAPVMQAKEEEAAPATEPEIETSPVVEAEPPEPEPDQSEEKWQVDEPKEPRLDSLTVIKGIGPRLQSKLYIAGINTYADLAESDPAKLRESLGQVARTANVEGWIKQAKKLV
ncbi:MAG: hypothetical protein K9K65_04750 [Desulfarculaceae bacterium]|nr:hypothetical protein [Desulfarculaceae bacterium]MCF8049464.1 hypothetical protein [Desulfarculaceae bacterium]MCF8097132.1 hypothetical protein [Desulfarculaceae bacterium]